MPEARIVGIERDVLAEQRHKSPADDLGLFDTTSTQVRVGHIKSRDDVFGARRLTGLFARVAQLFQRLMCRRQRREPDRRQRNRFGRKMAPAVEPLLGRQIDSAAACVKLLATDQLGP